MRGAEYYRAVWGDSYDKLARYYDAGLWAFGLLIGGEGRIRRRCIELAAFKPGDAVLDLCCGTGSLLAKTQAQSGGEGRFVGVDLSCGMLEVARRKCGGAGALLIRADAGCLPLKDEQFDVVTITLALHEMTEEIRTSVLHEAKRALRPAGKLLVGEMSRPPKGFSRFLNRVAIRMLSTVHEKKTLEELLQKGAESEVQAAGFRVTKREKFFMGFFQILLAVKN